MVEDKLIARISIESEAVTSQEAASKSINERRSSEIIGKFGEQNIADTVWSIAIEQDQQTLEGEGKTYQEAYADATSSLPQGQQPTGTLAVKVTEHYDLPCEKVVAKFKGRTKKEFTEDMKREIATFKSRYGKNFMEDKVLSVSYTVTLYSGGWKGREEKPRGTVLGTGASNKATEEAEERAKAQTGDKTPKGKIYEGTHEYKVIIAGMTTKEISDLVGKEAIVAAVPAVHTDSKTSGSSSRSYSKPSGACRTPQSTPVYNCI